MRRIAIRALVVLAITCGSGHCLNAPALAAPATQMFWTDQSTGRILRADLDGTNVQTIIQTPVVLEPLRLGVNRLAVDEPSGIIYWSDTATNTIQRVSLGGGAPETVASNIVFPRDLEIDSAGGKLYWSSGAGNDNGGIFRANLDGSQLETLVPIVSSPGIALDVLAGNLYYTQFNCDGGSDCVKRANLDGSGSQLLVPFVKDIDDIDLDLVAGKMYYPNEDDGQIFRANLDGTAEEKIVDMMFETGGQGLAINRGDGKLYWSSSNWAINPTGSFSAQGSIGRSNLDGSDVEILLSGGLNHGMVIASPVPEPGSIVLAVIAGACAVLTARRKVRQV